MEQQIKPNHYYKLNTGMTVKVLVLSYGGTLAFCQYVLGGDEQRPPDAESKSSKGPFYTQVDVASIREEVDL